MEHDVMPNGAHTSSVAKSSKDLPVFCSATNAATAVPGFEYS